MKVRLFSVFRISGIAKETGQVFGPLYRLSIEKPLELVDTAKFKRHGFGVDFMEQEISEEVFKKFSTLGHIPSGGITVELTTENQPGRRGVETVITGFVPPKTLQSAA